MARRKPPVNDKPKSRKRPEQRSRWRRFGSVVISTPVRQLLLLVIIVLVLFWQWSNIEAAAGSLVNMFGWGLLFIGGAIIVLVVRIWLRKVGTFLFHWHRWLGGVALALAVWGIIAFFNLGGTFGRAIIGYTDVADILRVLGLIIIGVFLLAPRASIHAIGRSLSWLVKQFERRPAPVRREVQPPLSQVTHTRPPVTSRPEPPVEMENPLIPPETATTRPPLPVQERAQAIPEPQKELKQVAQDVWRKYGQSPELVTVNGWRLPPVDILDKSVDMEFSDADNVQRARLIEDALASYGVETKVVQINTGPTVTQFGVEPGWDRKFKEVKERDRDGNIQIKQKEVSRTRVKVDRITSLANDLALALAAPTIRIEAPVPGKPVVGVEVPNTISNMVSLRGVLETSSFQKMLPKSRLALALGKGAGGEAVVSDLTKMPHLLIAGATGSGKTVCLNAIICCLLMHNTPYDIRFILVDPKRVELTPYNSIPHLAAPVIVDANKALIALRWLSKEMDERYQKLASAGARHIEGYNKTKQGEEKLPYLVLIIDELADLMMAGYDEVENILCRLAQLARATGIHLIVATQRPSVDVVTGLIKANFPTRISFAVTSQVDSRTILDMVGAEKLLGRGDMLFMPTEAAKPKRLQGCFLSDAEMERLVYFWGGQQEQEADRMKMEDITRAAAEVGGREYPRDPLLDAAKELATQHEHISTSFLQRRLHIGYPRAARLMEQLEEELDREGGEGESGDEG